MDQKQKPETKTPPDLGGLNHLLKNITPASIQYDAHLDTVFVYSGVLQEELKRLREAGHRRVSVTASVDGEVVVFSAGIERRSGRVYALRPMGETQEAFKQLYLQNRRPDRRKNPVPILILSIEPLE